MNITPDMLATAYEYLRASAPFSSYGLPDADEVEFMVIADRARYGCHWDGTRKIAVSHNCVGTTATLMWVLAHEMVHLVQSETHTYNRSKHNQNFHAIADIVCAEHGFDRKVFA